MFEFLRAIPISSRHAALMLAVSLIGWDGICGMARAQTDYAANLPPRGANPGVYYVATNDTNLTSKPVETACLNEEQSVGAATKFAVVPAHQPDYPVRPLQNSETNRRFNVGTELILSRDGTLADRRIAASAGTAENGATDPEVPGFLFMSALIYVVVEYEDGHVPLPLVPKYETEFRSDLAGSDILQGFASYRLDCGLLDTNEIAEDGMYLVATPLGRADLYPAFKVEAKPDGSQVDARKFRRDVNAAAVDAVAPWGDGPSQARDMSPLFLLDGGPTANFKELPENVGTYADLIRAYFAPSSPQASDELAPEFLRALAPENADTSAAGIGTVAFQFYGVGGRLVRVAQVGAGVVRRSPAAEPNPPADAKASDDDVPAGLQEVVLIGSAFSALEDPGTALHLVADAGCNFELQPPADGALRYKATCQAGTPDWLGLAHDSSPDQLDLWEAAFDQLPVDGIVLIEDSDVVLQKLLAVRAGAAGSEGEETQLFGENVFGMDFGTPPRLQTVVGRTIDVGACHEPVRITLEDVVTRRVALPPDCEGQAVTIRVPSDLIGPFHPEIVSGCGEPVAFNRTSGESTCREASATDEIMIRWAKAFDPFPVAIEAPDTQISREDVLRRLVLSPAFVEAAENALRTNPEGRVISATFPTAHARCREPLILDGDPPLDSLFDLGCEAIPETVRFRVAAVANGHPEDAFQQVETAGIDLTGWPEEIEGGSLLRPLEVDLDVMRPEIEDLADQSRKLNRYGRQPATSWRMVLFDNTECGDPPIGLVIPERGVIRQDGQPDDAPLTWPLHAHIRWYEGGTYRPGSDCVAARIKSEGPRSNTAGRAFFDFDLLPMVTGRGVILVALSEGLAQQGRRGAINDALLSFARSSQSSSIQVELWDVTATGQVVQRTSTADLLTHGVDVEQLVRNQLEQDAPPTPEMDLVRQNARLTEAENGAVMIFEGDAYDDSMDSVFVRLQSGAALTRPEKFRLFVLDGCETWTRFAPEPVRASCVDMARLDAKELRDALDAAFRDLLFEGDAE